MIFQRIKKLFFSAQKKTHAWKQWKAMKKAHRYAGIPCILEIWLVSRWITFFEGSFAFWVFFKSIQQIVGNLHGTFSSVVTNACCNFGFILVSLFISNECSVINILKILVMGRNTVLTHKICQPLYVPLNFVSKMYLFLQNKKFLWIVCSYTQA